MRSLDRAVSERCTLRRIPPLDTRSTPMTHLRVHDRFRNRHPMGNAAKPPKPLPDSNATPMRTLGPKSREWLQAIGIRTLADLRRRDAIAAFVALKRSRLGVSLAALYALAGAIEDRHWIEVKRASKLELLLALDEYERAHPAKASAVAGLRSLRNIGPAMPRDLDRLGVKTVAQLARKQPDRLYARLQELSGRRHDPCVWDTFAAAIHQARTGEALPWWHFTQERKRRMAEGSFVGPPRVQHRAQR
jgi:predicted flap endonuclease-1-like 5' DNA nuclease